MVSPEDQVGEQDKIELLREAETLEDLVHQKVIQVELQIHLQEELEAAVVPADLAETE
tara:strand:+ start:127 stop:300 length:174 start_codon:yes stop_codon:yes gene_type:complete